MRVFKLSPISVTLALSLWSTTALAQATDEGAAQLLSVLQTYLGTTQGVVSVAVSDDAYAVTVDVVPLMTKIPAEGLTATVSPLEFEVTDNGDGTWAYKMDQPVSLTYSIPGQMTTNTEYKSVQLSGVFDESLGDASEYQLDATGLSTEQVQTDPAMGEVKVSSRQESISVSGTAVAGAKGVDSQFTALSKGLTYELAAPGGAEGTPPMAFAVAVEEGAATGGFKGYKPEAFYGLLGWFVAHPDAALIEADKAGLKAEIEAALPLFENLSMNIAYKGVSALSPIGPIGADELGVTIDMNGAVSDGKFREAISIKGLSLPDGLVPAFAVPLVPSEMSIDVAASKFDLAAAIKVALGMLDLPAGAAPPAEMEGQMLAALLPSGSVDITLGQGGATAPAYKLGYEGTMSVGPGMPMPVGTARISLTGMAAINEALMASPPEMGMQDMAPMLGMAEAMAKPGADGELVWEVEMTPTGGVLVNGNNMMGGQ